MIASGQQNKSQHHDRRLYLCVEHWRIDSPVGTADFIEFHSKKFQHTLLLLPCTFDRGIIGDGIERDVNTDKQYSPFDGRRVFQLSFKSEISHGL